MPHPLNPAPPVRGAACPSTEVLDGMSVGETAVSPHVESCAACGGYLAALRSSADAFVKARPKELFTQQVARRAEGSARKSWRGASAAAAFAVVAVLVVLVLPNREPGVTFKGDVTVHVKRGDQTFVAKADEPLLTNDAIRFSVHTAAGYAAVLERDPSGAVTVVAPFGANLPQKVNDGTTTLEDSAVLDGASGKESFIAVFSEEPFDVQKVAKELEAQGSLRTCDGCATKTLTYDKKP